MVITLVLRSLHLSTRHVVRPQKKISTCRKQLFEASPISISCTDEEYNNTRFQSDIIPSGKTIRTARLYEQGLVYGDCIDDESFASATSEAPGQPALAAEPLISDDKPFEIGIVTSPRSCSRRRRTSTSTCNSICNNDLTWKILAVASEVESAYEMRHVKRLRCKDSADPVATKSSPSTRKATHKTKTPPRIITPSKKLVQECGFKMIENIHDVEHSDDSTASLSCDSSVGSKSSIRTSSEEFIVQMPNIELRTGSVQIPEAPVARSAAVVSQVAALSNMPFFLVVYLLFLLFMSPLAANVVVDPWS